MDSIGGAKILTERLPHGRALRDEVPAIAAEEALPLFHWTGVEPSDGPEAAPVPPPRRWWRLRAG
jgi:hypothetical protein